LLENFENSFNTLHTDGTSKFGKHYGTYDIVTRQGKVLVAGIREVASGDTDTQLSVLQSILKEVEEAVENDNSENVSNKIVCSIKNIMSDRHIVQKKFNTIFQEYRCSVLPHVVTGWKNLNALMKEKISKVNDFFCGMHFVVGLADQTEVALKVWDKLLYDDSPVGFLANG